VSPAYQGTPVLLRLLRMESPRISMVCALCTGRSRMSSASVGSPTCSCQRETGSCEVKIVERTWDNLLAGKLILPFLGEAACHSVVQRRWLWKLFRDQADRDSGIGLKLLGFIAESAFTIIPESYLGSPLWVHPGMAFGIIPESRSPWTGFLREAKMDFEMNARRVF
jgi:hypothetical protein